jgi:hypothetical protein
MSDLSKLSNDELMRMYKGGGNAPAPKTVNPPSDLSRFSDEELMQLYQKPQVEPAVPAPNMLNEIGRAVGRTVRSGGAGALGMLDLAETPIRMGMAGIADVIGAPQSAEQLRTDKTLSQGFKILLTGQLGARCNRAIAPKDMQIPQQNLWAAA